MSFLTPFWTSVLLTLRGRRLGEEPSIPISPGCEVHLEKASPTNPPRARSPRLLGLWRGERGGPGRGVGEVPKRVTATRAGGSHLMGCAFGKARCAHQARLWEPEGANLPRRRGRRAREGFRGEGVEAATAQNWGLRRGREKRR